MNKARIWGLVAAGIVFWAAAGLGFEEEAVQIKDCSFNADRNGFLAAQSRARTDIWDRVRKFSAAREGQADATATTDVPRRNFVDQEIFGKLAQLNVRSAALSTDEEFVRRVYLDLTGRIPAPVQIREFTGNSSPGKRDDLIDKLLHSPEFADKWSVWLGDLLQVTDRLSTNARAMQIEGRNNFHAYIRESLANQKPLKEIVRECITATGNNYLAENGPSNFPVSASAAMGPVQDTFDMMFSKSASMFLGLGHYDCLLCHSGRGHLDQINVWATRTARVEAQRMAAFLARTRLVPFRAPRYESEFYNSTEVVDLPNGQYSLNTTAGNRPPRALEGTEITSLTPEYRTGATPADGNWRAAFAANLVADPMFGRNFANRIWKQFFGLGLVDPVDTLDPDRLDPKNPPAAPWTLQATHPELLEKLAGEFVSNGTNLREFVRLLVQSSAYQLSSRYDGEWKYEYVQLFARHYPRRLMAEEVHDAITSATELPGRYTYPIRNGQTLPRGTTPLPQSEPVTWAMQLPGTNEPRNNTGNARNFMDSFLRGNRDTAARSEAGSIQQQLNLMNDPFVNNRVRVTASPALRRIASLSSNEEVLEEIFLTFLSRKPSARERQSGISFLEQAANRNGAVEDLAWVAINKVDFLFSY